MGSSSGITDVDDLKVFDRPCDKVSPEDMKKHAYQGIQSLVIYFANIM